MRAFRRAEREGRPDVANLTCPACGSVYALESVRNVDRFACAVCTHLIVVPMAGPSAARRARDEAPERAPIPVPAPAPPPVAPAPRSRSVGPIRAPASSTGAAAASAPAQVHPGGFVRRMRPFGTTVVWLFVAAIVMRLACMVQAFQLLTLADALERSPADREALVRAPSGGLAPWVLGLLACCGLGVAFVVWLHRAHANLRLAHLVKPEYASGWAIGAWFVPILSLFRPYQIVKETWRGSAFLAGSATEKRWKHVRTPGLLLGWWWAYLFHSGAGVAVIFADLPPMVSPGQLQYLAWIEIVLGVETIIAALLAIELVRRVTDMQERARSRLAQARREHPAE